MRLISKFAIAAAIVSGGAMTAIPALAQQAADAPAAAPAPEPRKLSKQAHKPILALKAAVDAKDAAAYQTTLAAALAAAQSADDRYTIAQMKLSQAVNTNDEAGKIAAVEEMIATGAARPAELPKLYSTIAGLHYNAKNLDQAGAALEKLRALDPNNTEYLWKLAELRAEQKQPAEAIALGEQAIEAAKAAGQTIDLNWYRRVLDIAYKSKLEPQGNKLARTLFAVSPEAKDRRNALLIFRQFNELDNDGVLDLMRLMRRADALSDANDYYSLANMLDSRNYPAEAQAVVNEGVAAGIISASDPKFSRILANSKAKVAEDKAVLPELAVRAQSEAKGDLAMRIANGYFGHGDYLKAAELYRMAAEKGVPDSELAKLRLGISLAMAGQKAEAETAFKAVSGPRSGLAGYWSAWLSKQA